MKGFTVEPGDIYILGKDELSIRCADGYVKIQIIQPENAKRMDIKAFLAGNRFNMLDKFIQEVIMDLKEMQKKVYENKIKHGFNVTDVPMEFCYLYGEVA